MVSIELDNKEKEMILKLIMEKVEYGGTIQSIRDYIRLFEKINGEKIK